MASTTSSLRLRSCSLPRRASSGSGATTHPGREPSGTPERRTTRAATPLSGGPSTRHRCTSPAASHGTFSRAATLPPVPCPMVVQPPGAWRASRLLTAPKRSVGRRRGSTMCVRLQRTRCVIQCGDHRFPRRPSHLGLTMHDVSHRDRASAPLPPPTRAIVSPPHIPSCSPHAQKPYPLIPSPSGVASRPVRLAAAALPRSHWAAGPHRVLFPGSNRCQPPQGADHRRGPAKIRKAGHRGALDHCHAWARRGNGRNPIRARRLVQAKRCCAHAAQHAAHVAITPPRSARAPLTPRPSSFAPCRVPHASRVCWGCVPPAHPQQCHACAEMRHPFKPP